MSFTWLLLNVAALPSIHERHTTDGKLTASATLHPVQEENEEVSGQAGARYGFVFHVLPNLISTAHLFQLVFVKLMDHGGIAITAAASWKRIPWHAIFINSTYRRTSNYWITSGEKTSVYRGNLGSRRSVLVRKEILKEQLSFCRHYLLSLLHVDLSGSANCEIKFQILAIQY